jgi:hypothetical protein
MWKYLAALLVVLLSLGGLVTAQAPKDCADCYANMVLQTDTQTVDNVRLALGGGSVAVGNEGLSAGIIVTKAPVEPNAGDMFVPAPFARIDQTMTQTVSNLGNLDVQDPGMGAKGITWNKAIQAAWIANQGVKELENGTYVKEGTHITQSTTQLTDNVFDYDSREGAKVLNVDNKLAMVVDDMNAVLNLTAGANSGASNSESATGVIKDNSTVNVGGKVS